MPGDVQSRSSRLVRHGLLLTVVLGVANIANVAFHTAMGRMLTPADYGTLLALIGVLYVVNVPAESLRVAAARHAAAHSAGGGEAAVMRAVLRRALVEGGLLWLMILVLVAIAAGRIQGFLRIDSPGPVRLAAAAAMAAMGVTLVLGVLQGLQMFRWYGLTVIVWFGLRLVASFGLVADGFGAEGALGGMAVGGLAGMFAGAACLVVILPRVSGRGEAGMVLGKVRRIYREAGIILVGYAAYLLMGNIDVIAVKHWYEPRLAGDFAQASLIAHALWLLPYGVAAALVPKVVHRRAAGDTGLELLYRGLVLAGAIVAGYMALVLWKTETVYGFMFRRPDHPLAGITGFYFAAMFPLAPVFVLLNYAWAEGRFRSCLIVLAWTVGAVAAAVMLHGRIVSLLAGLAACNWGLLIHLGVDVYRRVEAGAAVRDGAAAG